MKVTELLAEASLLSGLFKYQDTPKDRVPKLLSKLKANEPFTIRTVKGEEEVVFAPSALAVVQNWLKNPTTNITLQTNENPPRNVPFGAIVKTKDFGGEPSGHREKVEQGQIAGIAQELEAAKAGAAYINLRVGNRTVRAASVSKTKETVNGSQPKSDMTVYDPAGNAVAWVSLKDKKFRWGGWQHLALLPDIAKWIEKVISATNGGVLQPGDAFAHHIPEDIVDFIVYGKDFASGVPGISNVDAVLIGWAHIKKSGKQFILSSDTVYGNGEMPTEGHEPYLVIRYMLGRNDLGLTNARGETNTKSEGRKVKFL